MGELVGTGWESGDPCRESRSGVSGRGAWECGRC
jgi:hypothetical protein